MLEESLDGLGLVGTAEQKAAPEQFAPAPPGQDEVLGWGADFNIGMEAYSRGDCETATAALNRVISQYPSLPSKTPYAMHHIARCEKRRGKFGKALPWYEKLLRRFPGYGGRAEALSEAATCHQRLGQIGPAKAKLEELSRIPGWESRAEQGMDALVD